ncbi:hypothetical protein QTP88_021649 [Uroleucon formosanum]
MPFSKHGSVGRSQRAIAVKAYYKSGNCLTAARREFRRHYNLGGHDRVPSCKAVKSWVENFEEAGSALKKKPPGAQQTQRTPQNIEAVQTSFEKSPRRSLKTRIREEIALIPMETLQRVMQRNGHHLTDIRLFEHDIFVF